jgi:hypothetical protein
VEAEIMSEMGRGAGSREADRVVELDLRTVSLPEQGPRLRRAAWQLSDGETLRVRVGQVPWPALAAVSGGGFSYRLLSASDGGTDIAVSPRYTDDERRRYLLDPLRPRPGYPANVGKYLGASLLEERDS